MAHPLVDAVRHAADAQPGHIARDYYQRQGRPECIIGTALHALGVSVDDLAFLDSFTASEISKPRLVAFVEDTLGAAPSTTERDWLQHVQSLQDDDEQPWGVAVAKADAAFPL